MPALPPADMVFQALREVVVPAAGAAALGTGLFLALGRWAGALGAGVGAPAGVAFANWQQGKAARLAWTPGDKTGDWLLVAILALVAVGLLTRWLGLAADRYLNQRRGTVSSFFRANRADRPGQPLSEWWGSAAVVWVPRAVAVVVVAGWVVPVKLAEEEPNLRWAVAGAMLLAWLPADNVARRGAGGQVLAYLSACLLAAGGVMLYAHSGKLTEAATMVGMALFGVAVIGGAARADVSGAIPAAVAFLPGFLAGGRYLTADPDISKVPVGAFVLAALAPLALLPFLIPQLGRRNDWFTRAARLVLILTPLGIALVLADAHETLAFGDDW